MENERALERGLPKIASIEVAELIIEHMTASQRTVWHEADLR